MNVSSKKIILITIILFIMSVITFVSCDKDGISEDEAQIQYHREAQLTNTYNNGIALLNISFVNETNNLKEIINTFNEAPTIFNLENSQQQWLDVLKIWKNLELYNVGVVEDTFINFEINRWPTNTDIIEGFINSNSLISEAFVASNGSSSKGIAAIEYLLFSTELNLEVLSTFTTGINAERRRSYLLALSKNLVTKAKQWQQLWINFQSIFTSSVQNGLSGSQNQLANAMVTLSEQIVIKKLGHALGETNGGNINIEALENYRSGLSLISIRENVEALYKCYTGNYREDIIKWGFNDYLDLVGATNLNYTINNSFTNCFEKINAITVSLKEQLQNDPQSILELQDALRSLEVLIKVDMANAIGSTITVNSNDGD